MAIKIHQIVIDYALKQGLEIIKCDNGRDYVFRELPNGKQAIIADPEPEGLLGDLDQSAYIVVFDSDAWTDGLVMRIPTVRQAIDTLKYAFIM